MEIIPAIDLKDNKCVRLLQGRAENMEVFSDDPCAVAREWTEKGAKRLHIVDLNGAFLGKPVHESLIKKIAQEINIPIQVGGGIRKEKTIRSYLEYGVQRVVLGTVLLNQKTEKLKYLSKQFGHHLIAGIDVRNNRIAIQGWVKEMNYQIEQFIAGLKRLGIQRIIYTDINRDGMLKGPNINMIQKIGQKNGIKIIASGGISTIKDLYQLQKLENVGLEGVIIGKALYKGMIDLEEVVKIFYEREKS